MTKSTRRKRALRLHSSAKLSKTRKSPGLRGTIINSAIFILSLLLIAFIFSFSKKQTQQGVPIEMTFPNLPDQPKLAVEIYEANPIADIEVEVLNGCGETGLAGKLSEFLRSHQIDVVRADDADHYNYTQTLIIARNENFEGLKEVASSLGFNVEDKTHVLIQPDSDADVDITLIIGKDFKSIKPISDFLKKTL